MNQVEACLSAYKSMNPEDKVAMEFAIKQDLSKGSGKSRNFSESLISPIIKALDDFEQLIERVPVDQMVRKKGVHMISIGEHIAHVLDVFRFVLERAHDNYINLAKARMEVRCDYDDKASLKSYLVAMRNQVKNLLNEDFTQEIIFKDKIGAEDVQIISTLGAAIYEAYSHSQHHFVTIGDIIKSEMERKAS